jgi:hypothetical protein
MKTPLGRQLSKRWIRSKLSELLRKPPVQAKKKKGLPQVLQPNNQVSQLER